MNRSSTIVRPMTWNRNWLDKAKAELAEAGYPDASPEDVLSYALFPEVALPFFAKRDEQRKAAQESAVTE